MGTASTASVGLGPRNNEKGNPMNMHHRISTRLIAGLLFIMSFMLVTSKMSVAEEYERARKAGREALKPDVEPTVDETVTYSTQLSSEEPRVIEVLPNVFVADGYDIAKTVVIATSDGNVVIDTGSCDDRAREMRAALVEHASGPTEAVIYTHHQIEQIGGGGVWADNPEVAVWAAESMPGEFLRQYVLLDRAVLRRGIRQYGLSMPEEMRIPVDTGRSADPSSLERVPMVRMPTETVQDEATFTVGDVEFQLFAAPGETKDHLMVWIPSLKVLIAGDNIGPGFPQVNHMRGSPPRSPDKWISTLDRMREFEPEYLISSQLQPISGSEEVLAALVDYRDALHWLREETLRAINRGDSIDQAAESIQLPERLAESPYLGESSDRVGWAVRAMYTSYVGWFDERPEALFPCDKQTAEQREVEMMGGPEAVLDAAQEARRDGDHRWALHLLAKLRNYKLDTTEQWAVEYAETLVDLSRELTDTHAANYLASMANEVMTSDQQEVSLPCPEDETILQIPVATFFEIMSLRLKTDCVMDKHESIVVYITDEKQQYNVTIRHGVLEVDEGEPLPGMPKPGAVLVADGLTFRKMCLGVISPLGALTQGKLEIRGNKLTAQRFTTWFHAEKRFSPQELSKEITDSKTENVTPGGAKGASD